MSDNALVTYLKLRDALQKELIDELINRNLYSVKLARSIDCTSDLHKLMLKARDEVHWIPQDMFDFILRHFLIDKKTAEQIVTFWLGPGIEKTVLQFLDSSKKED